MSNVPFPERLLALKDAITSHIWSPQEHRITPIRLWPVRGLSADDVRPWAAFDADPESEFSRRVGVVVLSRTDMVRAQQEYIGAQLGMLVARRERAAVLFARWLPHVGIHLLRPMSETDLQFGIHLSPDSGVRVTPAFRLPNGSVMVPPGAIKDTKIRTLQALPLGVKVYSAGQS